MPKLTRTLINAQAPAEREQIIWDTEVPGFGVRVMPSGAKSYLVKYRIGRGRRAPLRKPTLGRIGDLSLEQARHRAREWKAAARDGIDPSELQRLEAQAPTMEQLCADYMEHHGSFKRSGSEDKRKIEVDILPLLRKSKRVKDVSRRDIENLRRVMSDRPYAANRVLALLSKMFSMAEHWGWRNGNPVHGVQRYSEEKRERYLSANEIRALATALDEYAAAHGTSESRDAADAIRLLMLTGARKNEVLSARWEQFNLQSGVWTKPSAHTKQKKVHRVPLSPGAVTLLSSRPDARRGYLFPGLGGSGHRSDLKRPWAEIRTIAGLEDVRLHDLRHTFASLLASGGVSLPIIGALLGHTQVQTTARYAHLADEALREATDRISRAIDFKKVAVEN